MSSGKTPDFDKIPLYSYTQTECSPTFEELSPKVRGVRINAPAKVSVQFDETGINPASRIPLCLTMQFQGDVFAKYEDVFEHVTVVMVNKQTGKSYSGILAIPDPSEPVPPDKDLSPVELAARTVRKYMNANLIDHIVLPPGKATYFVHALFEGEKSNTVTIEVK